MCLLSESVFVLFKYLKKFTSFFCLLLLATFSFYSPAFASAKEANEIVNGGKWYMRIAHKSTKGVNATIVFNGKGTVRFYAESHTLRGKYRVVGSKVCLNIYKLWGPREKCGNAQKKNGVYLMGNFVLRKKP